MLGCTILAICIIAFGVLHFVYPVSAPGIPPMFEYVGFLIPGHAFWVYSNAAVLVCAGVSILINRQTRLAAAWIGVMMLLFDLLVWGPGFFSDPGESAGNWLKDLGFVGGALILAGALPKENHVEEVPSCESPRLAHLS